MKTCCKVGICGHFGNGKSFLDGQTVKTKMIYQILRMKMNSVDLVDTYCWQKKIFQFIANCILLIRKSENIILLPAQNGVKIFIPFFCFLNFFFKKKIHYVVIGGWLPDFLEQRKWLCFFLNKLDGIYVEAHAMRRKLEALRLKNVYYMPNCKELHILNESELVCSTAEPYRLCTFSRVMKEKGIEDAVKAVKAVNVKCKRTVYTLDIYGQVDSSQVQWFEELRGGFPDYIRYKGSVSFEKSVYILKNYFALLFPTYYEGEGFAGTIIDAYSAGLPIVASDWKYNREIVVEGKTGILFPAGDIDSFEKKLQWLMDNSILWNNMKINCLKKAEEYLPENVLSVLVHNLIF